LLLVLEVARNDGTYRKSLATYINSILLVIDERLLIKPTDHEQKDIL
jgi:hypothetical protein